MALEPWRCVYVHSREPRDDQTCLHSAVELLGDLCPTPTLKGLNRWSLCALCGNRDDRDPKKIRLEWYRYARSVSNTRSVQIRSFVGLGCAMARWFATGSLSVFITFRGHGNNLNVNSVEDS
ncbi:hypothetical protein BGY98DRAFT_936181 [Russula aff. rugulosa BPL654]|nr:hypothetical protein BGY98DRAFT_936181 [Russula aff. rugulosa BPL654]